MMEGKDRVPSSHFWLILRKTLHAVRIEGKRKKEVGKQGLPIS